MAGIVVSLGCTTMAAATIGAGWYISSNAQRIREHPPRHQRQIDASFARKRSSKRSAASADHYALSRARLAVRRSDAPPPRREPDLCTSPFPQRADRSVRQRQPHRRAAPETSAAEARVGRDVQSQGRRRRQSQRAGTQLASLGPPGELNIQPQDDAQPGRTAIYDITAQALYMPNGEKLEAHSGLRRASWTNRSHVHLRMRGATPPNSIPADHAGSRSFTASRPCA